METSKKRIITTLTLSKDLVEKLKEHYGAQNNSQTITNALADFLLLPDSEQILDDTALAQVLTIAQELNIKKFSIRIPSALFTVVKRLSGEQTVSETVNRMLARVLYKPLNSTNPQCTSRLLYVMGNKWDVKMQNSIRHIAETADTKWETSVETCVGGLGIFSNINFAPNQIINDNNWDIANFIKVIKDFPRELIAGARALDVNKKTFIAQKSITPSPSKHADIDAAVRFLYLNLTSVWGHCDCFNKTSTAEKYIHLLNNVYPLHRKLQGVEIFDQDLFEILKKFRKRQNVLFIVDPPYIDTSGYEERVARNVPSYGKMFGLEQHRRLSICLRNIKQKEKKDFIYFCRVSATRHKDKETKQLKNTPQELAKQDRNLQLKIGKLFFGRGFYYIDVNTSPDGTVERIITSFDFKGATKYGANDGTEEGEVL